MLVFRGLVSFSSFLSLHFLRFSSVVAQGSQNKVVPPSTQQDQDQKIKNHPGLVSEVSNFQKQIIAPIPDLCKNTQLPSISLAPLIPPPFPASFFGTENMENGNFVLQNGGLGGTVDG